jgi:lipopolysaccharide assembly outer membrane protein LptD (OstA)
MSAKRCNICILVLLTFFSLNDISYSWGKWKKSPVPPKSLPADFTTERLRGNKIRLLADKLDIDRKNESVADGNVILFGTFGILNTAKLRMKEQNNLLYFNNGFRILTNSNLILLGSDGYMNSVTQLGKINNAQLLFADNSSLFIDNLDKVDNDRIVGNNMIFSSCLLPNAKLLDRKTRGMNEGVDKFLDDNVKYNVQDNIEIPNEIPNATNTENKELRDKYKSMPITISADKIDYNVNTKLLKLENAKLKIANNTFLSYDKMERYMNKDNPKSGLLFPVIRLFGMRQIGIGVPIYIRPATNYDFKITPVIYQDIINNIAPGKTTDSNRTRRHTVLFEYKHLLWDSSEDRSEGRFEIKGAITPNVGSIDNITRKYKTLDGQTVYGDRWYFNAKGRFGLTKTAYMKFKLMRASDPNYMMIYHTIFRPYSRNYISLFDVRENSYNKLEVVRFDPLLMSFNSGTIPNNTPIFRSIFETNKDKLGGRFITSSDAVYLNRSDGFSRQSYNGSLGYELPMITDAGHRIKFSMTGHLDSYRTSFNNISNQYILYLNTPANIQTYYYNGYNYVGNYMPNLTRTYLYTRLGISHPFVNNTIKGYTFTVEPKIMYHNGTDGANTERLVAENGFNSVLSYNNIFGSVSSGHDIVDTGQRLSYGVESSVKDNKGRSLSYFAGKLKYLNRPNNFFNSQYGLNTGDYISSIRYGNQDSRIFHEARFSGISQLPYAGFNGQKFTMDGITLLSTRGQLVLAYSNFTGVYNGTLQTTSMMNIGARYKFDNDIAIGGGGVRILSVDNTSSGTSTTSTTVINDGKPRWLMMNAYVMKESNCAFYGVEYIMTNYLGVGVVSIYRIRYGIKI